MRITLEVKNTKAAFFLELLQTMSDFVMIENTAGYEEVALTDEHITILEERLAAYERAPESLVDWDEFQQNFRMKQ